MRNLQSRYYVKNFSKKTTNFANRKLVISKTMKNSSEIRQAFLDFFALKNHQIVSSAPMVLKNDPTLMFTNAGMNQFKDIFLDNKQAQHLRVADTQKCLRVSGKHNDLEEVGHDTYHHTMFEMLGNWSFGDYFKKEAIEWAYDLLTNVYGISKDILYATYFEGDPSENLEVDIEAKALWEKLLPADRVLPGNKKDNFWEMGESGPCGPCSEIHVDLRTQQEKAEIHGSLLVNKDHPQVIEIWNLVFIQFNRDMHSKLHPLKNKHVDTGMGFERLCRVIQGKTSNYDSDVFMPYINKLEEISGLKYGDNEKADIAFRVVSDHLRAVAFAIADGQIPSNVKAGYVIRRILRRAIRYGYTFLNFDKPFIFKLIPSLVDNMGKFFPELVKQQTLIEKVIFEEEQSFLRALETGIHKFEDFVKNIPQNQRIDGKFVFELYDTYGFPLDLTELLAKEKGLSIEIEEFNKLLNQQKERSRKDAVVDKEDWIIIDENPKCEFVGYDELQTEISITRYRRVNKKGKDYFHLVFNKTPFYAESGGQIGDTGQISDNDEIIEIIDTVKELDVIIHISEKMPKNPKSIFRASVNITDRENIIRNHSATHLMHNALRKVLGEHVEQKGSLVTKDNLRFDFAHFQKMSAEDIEKVELLVNEAIRSNFPLQENREMEYEKALESGAIALFGEKYEEKVRVIGFGDAVELCGGTHVKATGSIGLFKIISESAIAAGIRRIEAVSGEKAFELMQNQWKTIQNISSEFNNPKNLIDSISNLKENYKKLEKKIEEIELSNISSFAKELIKEAELKNDIYIIAKRLSIPSSHIKTLIFELRNHSKESYFYVLGNEADEKVSLSVIISDNLIKEKNLHAGNIVKSLAKEIGGGGGGQANFATAGGTNSEKLDLVISQALKFVE